MDNNKNKEIFSKDFLRNQSQEFIALCEKTLNKYAPELTLENKIRIVREIETARIDTIDAVINEILDCLTSTKKG